MRPSPRAHTYAPTREPRADFPARAQAARLVVDVARLDLRAAESTLGPFHITTEHFRRALADAQRTLDRMRADHGSREFDGALRSAPAAFLRLAAPGGEFRVALIEGRPYAFRAVEGTPLAPRIWRVLPLPDGTEQEEPYHACRLADRTTRCDCAGWIYHRDGLVPPPAHCKHLAALAHLGWL